ncbi:hypothetical protein [Bacillus wiedmannii]|nr:hypothetical protein [Bacillus wiedmannii]
MRSLVKIGGVSYGLEEVEGLDMKLQKKQAEYERIRDELKMKVEGE